MLNSTVVVHNQKVPASEVFRVSVSALFTTPFVKVSIVGCGVVLAYCGVYLIEGGPAANTNAAVFSLCIPAMLCLVPVGIARRVMTTSSVTFQFSPRNIRISAANDSVQIEWSTVRKTWETQNAIFFYAHGLHMVAKGGFSNPSELAQVIECLRDYEARFSPDNAAPIARRSPENRPSTTLQNHASTPVQSNEPPEESIELRAYPSADDWSEAIEIISPYGISVSQTVSVIGLALVIAFVVGVTGSTETANLAAKLVVLVIVAVGGVFAFGRAQIWMYTDNEEPLGGNYTFSPLGLSFRGSGHSFTVPWGGVEAGFESKKVFVIQVASVPHVIPTSSIRTAEQLQQFRKLLTSSLGRRFKKIYG